MNRNRDQVVTLLLSRLWTTSNNIYGLTSPRFNRLSSNLEAFEIGSTYKDYRLTRNFIDSLAPSADIDKSSLARMALNITASYRYDDDRAYFEGEKLFEPSFGTDLIEGKIREANKYETYGALLDGNRSSVRNSYTYR